MRIYKVVRSYESGRTGETELQEFLDKGYEYLRASEYIPPTIERYGYIEYILVKEVEDVNDKDIDS